MSNFNNPWAAENSIWFEKDEDKNTWQIPQIQSQVLDIKPKIITSFWCDGNRTKVRVHEYEKDLRIYIKGENIANKNLFFKLYDYDKYSYDEFLSKFSIKLSKNETSIIIHYNSNYFIKSKEKVANIFYTIQIEDQSKIYTFPLKQEDYISNHLIVYIPSFMKSLSPPWNVAASVMEEWFNRSETGNKLLTQPNLDIIKMSWLLSFNSAFQIYSAMLTDEVWCNEPAKKELWKQIKKSPITLPKVIDDEKSFNFLNEKIVLDSSKNAYMTIADVYHHQSRPFEVDWREIEDKDLNDLLGALGKFDFRIASAGKIKKIEKGFEITITRIGVFIRDQYDFIDESIKNQPLGRWDVKNKTPHRHSSSTTFTLYNSDYLNYSQETGKGGDYILYSDIKEEIVSETFNVLRS